MIDGDDDDTDKGKGQTDRITGGNRGAAAGEEIDVQMGLNQAYQASDAQASNAVSCESQGASKFSTKQYQAFSWQRGCLTWLFVSKSVSCACPPCRRSSVPPSQSPLHYPCASTVAPQKGNIMVARTLSSIHLMLMDYGASVRD